MSRWQRLSQFAERASWSLQQLRGPKSCTTKLPVELLQDVDGLGTVGSVVRVNHGYARHFLVPNRIAAVRRGKQSGSVGEKEAFNSSATSSSSSSSSASSANALSEEEKHKLRIDQQRRRLESAIKKLTSQTLMMRRKVNDKGQLDKPVTAQDVADAVARQMQIEIVSDLVDMGGEELLGVGEYELPLKLQLANGQRAVIDVNVVST